MKKKQLLTLIILILSLFVFSGCNKNKIIKEELSNAYKKSITQKVDKYYEFLQKACLIDFIKSGYIEYSLQFKNISDFSIKNNSIQKKELDVINSLDNLKFIMYSAISDKKFEKKVQFLIFKNNKSLPLLNLGTTAKNFLISTPFSKNQTFTAPISLPAGIMPFSLESLHKKLKDPRPSAKKNKDAINKKLDKYIDTLFKSAKVKKDGTIYTCEFKDKELKDGIKYFYNSNIASTNFSKVFEPTIKEILSKVNEDSKIILTTKIENNYIQNIEIKYELNSSKPILINIKLSYEEKKPIMLTMSSNENNLSLIMKNTEHIYECNFNFSGIDINILGDAYIDFNKSTDNCVFNINTKMKSNQESKFTGIGLFEKSENEAKYIFPDIQIIPDVSNKKVLHSEFIALYSKNHAKKIQFNDKQNNLILLALTNKDKMTSITNEIKYDLKSKLEELLEQDLSKLFN